MTALGGKGAHSHPAAWGWRHRRRPPSPRAAKPRAQGKRLGCVAGYPPPGRPWAARSQIPAASLQVWVPARQAERVPQMSYSPARCRMSLSSRWTTVPALLYRQPAATGRLRL